MKKTPLTEFNRTAGGRMVEFAGYEMPIQFEGIVAEHGIVRHSAGFFDVSHMGHARIANVRVSRLLSRPLEKMTTGRGTYCLIMREDGGIVDDAFVYRFGEHDWHIILNASRKEVDVEYLGDVEAMSDLAMIAVQGPRVVSILGELCGRRCIAEGVDVLGVTSRFAARTGYTGEDGFEVVLAGEHAETLAERLVDAGIKPCGLGSRDLLRLEAALPLYGNDISETVDPYEAGLGFAVDLERDDFIAAAALRERKAHPRRRRAGLLLPKGPVPRHGFEVLDASDAVVGEVTSGSFSPLLEKGIALTLVAAESVPAAVRIRNSVCPATESELPFYRRPRA